jgi:periodic tryptophan protein 2
MASRFQFGFHVLLGPVYGQSSSSGSHSGANLLFLSSTTLLSPVGNRVNAVDLRNNRTRTLPFETRENIALLVLSPDGHVLLAVDTRGASVLVAMPKGVEVGRFTFKNPVTAAKFSPDGSLLLVALGRFVEVYRTPSVDRKQFNAFVLVKTMRGAFDDVEAIDFSADSKHVLLGSRDMTTRVYALHRSRRCGVLGGNRDFVVAAAFDSDKTSVFTVSRDSRLVCWRWSFDPVLAAKLKNGDEDSDSSDSDASSSSSSDNEEEEEIARQDLSGGHWKMEAKHYFNTGGGHIRLKCASFHLPRRMVVVGFSDGLFGIYSVDTMECIHTLSMGDSSISSIAVNPSGDWLAFGSAKAGQLLVWEWQSETYVAKQQAHAEGIRRVCYSPDGRLLATGGQDGKVSQWWECLLAKQTSLEIGENVGYFVWSLLCHVWGAQGSNHGLVFQSERKCGFFVFNGRNFERCVIALFLQKTQLKAGFDLTRYRNFRTLASPNPVQFSCLAMDPSGEIICAGTLDDFTVYVFNVQTGALLEVKEKRVEEKTSFVEKTIRSFLAMKRQ